MEKKDGILYNHTIKIITAASGIFYMQMQKDYGTGG